MVIMVNVVDNPINTPPLRMSQYCLLAFLLDQILALHVDPGATELRGS